VGVVMMLRAGAIAVALNGALLTSLLPALDQPPRCSASRPLSGIVDVDAVTISIARMAGGDVDSNTAAGAHHDGDCNQHRLQGHYGRLGG
jgi:hypothetical protein